MNFFDTFIAEAEAGDFTVGGEARGFDYDAPIVTTSGLEFRRSRYRNLYKDTLSIDGSSTSLGWLRSFRANRAVASGTKVKLEKKLIDKQRLLADAEA